MQPPRRRALEEGARHVLSKYGLNVDVNPNLDCNAVPVTEVVFLEGRTSQREDVQKGPEGGAGVTEVEDDVL